MKTKIIAILVFASLMTKLNAQNHDKVGLLEKPVPVSSVRNITDSSDIVWKLTGMPT